MHYFYFGLLTCHPFLHIVRRLAGFRINYRLKNHVFFVRFFNFKIISFALICIFVVKKGH